MTCTAFGRTVQYRAVLPVSLLLFRCLVIFDLLDSMSCS